MASISQSPLLGLGVGLANAPAAAIKAFDDYDTRKQRREGAKLQKQQGELRLAQIGRADALAQGTQDLQFQAMQQQLQQQTQQLQLQGKKLFREDTYRSIDGLIKEGNFKQFNSFLKESNDNPYAPSSMKDTVRIDPISLDSETDRQALQAAGITTEQLDNLDGSADGQVDWELVKKRYVLATKPDGTKEVRDIHRLGVVTGYGDWADAQGRNKLLEMVKLRQMTQPKSNTKPSSFAEKTAAEAAYQRTVAEGKEPSASQVAAHQLFLSETGGDREVRRAGAEDAIAQFAKKGFLKLSQEELLRGKHAPEARKLVRAIETEYGMTTADKKRLTDLSKVSALSISATTMSEEQTGLVDKFISSTSSYINEDTKTKMGKMAYGALMNAVRHSLFGSAQTDGELKLFSQAYGTLGQKTGPVLAGLSQALQQVKTELETVTNRYPDAVVKLRVGKSRADLVKAVDALDQRIEFYNLVAEGKAPEEAHAAVWGDRAPKSDPSQVPDSQSTPSAEQGAKTPEELMAELEAEL